MCYLQRTGLSTNIRNWSKCQNITIREIDQRVLDHQFNRNQEIAGKAVCRKGLLSSILF